MMMIDAPRRLIGAGLVVLVAACQPATGASQAPAAPIPARAPSDSFRIRPGVALVANQQSADVSIIDLATGATTRVGVGIGAHEAAISGDGRWGVATVYGAQVPEGIAVTPDGREVWVGSNQLGTVTVVDAASGTVSATLPGFEVPYRLTVSPDGRLVIVCDPEANRIAIIDRATRTVVGEVAGLGSPRGVMVAADNRTALVTLGTENAVAVIDLVGRRVVRRIVVGQSPDGVAVRLSGVP